jgi:SAM-dependent methyltransferase
MHFSDFHERMVFANPDKRRMLDFISPGRVADLGTGTGSLVGLLQGVPGCEVVGFDCSEQRLQVARQLYPDTRFYHKNLLDPNAFAGFRGSFNTAILSSVIHEIDWPYGLEAGSRVCKLAWSLLNNEGILILRDGVKPRNGAKQVRVEFRTEYGRCKFHSFVSEYRQRSIEFFPTGVQNSVTIGRYDLHDVLCKYYFEGALWTHDLDQVFGMRCQQQYHQMLGGRFMLQHSETYIASYLRPMWERDFRIIGSEFPNSHILLVAKK